MDHLQKIQRKGVKDFVTLVLKRSDFISGCGTVKTTHRAILGQRGTLLHGPVAPLRRSQLPQPQSLGYHSGPGQEGHLRGRAAGLCPHRDYAHSNEPAEDGKKILLRFVPMWFVASKFIECS
jgi:hypothetical protein